MGYDDEIFPEVIKALEDGRLDHDVLLSWITARVQLRDVVKQGLQELVNNKAKHMKILVQVNKLD